MKSHTSEFKEEIKTLGKQQSVRITYTINDEQIVLGSEDINSATPNYKASLLKSVMKGFDIDSNVNIPKGTKIKFEYGLLVNGEYEYLNYGNYIVYSSEKQEDTLSYKITCYDKMLYSMKDYEHIEVNYPCKIKKFLTELCKKIGLEFKDSTFANQDREFANELFMTINEDGTYSSMGYTYRDVLDQIAETTGGCICMTLDDKVEVRYINETINYETSKKSTNIEFESSVKEIVKIEELDGKSTQATRSGKNLAILGVTSGTIDGVPFTVNKGIININGTTPSKNANYYFNSFRVSNSGIATFCIEVTGYIDKPSNNASVLLQESSDNSTWSTTKEISCKSTTQQQYQITLDNSKYYRIRFYTSENTFTNATIKIQLEYGTNKTEFEEAGASPSPEFPSEIKSVGDEGTVTIEQRGKNLGKNNIVSGQKGGLTITKYDDDTFRVQGTTTGDVYIFGSENNIDLEAGTYILSGCPTGGSSQTYDLFLDGVSGTNDYGNERTFSITEHISSKYVLRIRSGQTVDFIAKPMLRFATIQDNTYEPYFSKDYVIPITPLRSLPNGTKDTIEEDGIHRNMLIADMGDLDWIYSNGRFYTRSLEDKAKGNSNGTIVSNIMCNVYNAVTPAEWYSKTKTGIAVGGNGYGDSGSILIYDSNYTSASAFKEAMKGNYIQYELSEEVVEPFTDEQLEVINSIETQKGTNIFELESNAILNYPINYDTIDEEYINDVNVNFG